MNPRCDVAVDFAGRELRGGAARNRPGAALVLADREERNVAEQIVAGADDAVEARFGEARDRRETPRASAGSSCAISSSIFAQTAPRGAARARNGVEPRARGSRRAATSPPSGELRFVEVEHDQQRLGGQELKAAQPLEIVALRAPARAAACRLRAPPCSATSTSRSRFELGGPRSSSDPSRGVPAGVRRRRGRRGSARLPSPARRAPDRSTRRDAARPDRGTRGRRGRARRRSCRRRHRPAPARPPRAAPRGR